MAGMHIADWIIFAVMLIFSCAIGLYHSCTGGKQQTNDEYLMGNRQMKLVPSTISMTVSFLSSILILGIPAEMYQFGTQFFMASCGLALAAVFAAYIYVPVFYPIKMTSINKVSDNGEFLPFNMFNTPLSKDSFLSNCKMENTFAKKLH